MANHPVYRMLLKSNDKELKAYILSNADSQYREWALDLYVHEKVYEAGDECNSYVLLCTQNTP